MTTIEQTARKNEAVDGFTGILRGSFQAGLRIAESMHQFAVEIPLNMLQIVGVSDEQTTALKEKHRNLLRGMYGSIDSVVTKFADSGEEQAGKLASELGQLAEDTRPSARVKKGTEG